MDYLYSLSCKGLKRLSLLAGEAQIDKILDNYDFIGVTDRFDESLVVLQLLLGLETSDILYLSSKKSGNYDDGFNGMFLAKSLNGITLTPRRKMYLHTTKHSLTRNARIFLFRKMAVR